jgi:hypothetical protein
VRLRRRRLQRDGHLPPLPRRPGRRLIGLEAGRRRGRHRQHAAVQHGGCPACCTAPSLRPAGRGRPDPRVALDLGRPGLPERRPEHSFLQDSGRREYRPITDARRWTRSRCCAAPRGSSPRSRARTRWPAL